ncbi:hypothetical protein [Paenibacillus terrae]|uniref:Uncharacterized protein n=1 Tax=Paenibacillus terrae TaxID=159743 RepID=A0A0D7WT41_9BACL|nr:hypothetical protein [Paenibacillus terrae]KJD42315.1 hypothetical protein QD47_28970 [Paenibacillus terrae]
MDFSNWATGNSRGHTVGPIFVPEGNEISGIEVCEQAGFGVVDVRFHFRNQNSTTSEESQMTGWIANNHAHNIKSVFVDNDKTVIGLQVKEAAGFGVVDIRLIYKKKNGTSTNEPFSDWVTDNPSFNWLKETLIPGEGHASGLEGREEAGFGIVDLRLVYDDIKV